MIITAHGGALGTGRNTQKYFDAMQKIDGVDALEVDVRKCGKRLYLGHTFIPFRKKNRIAISCVLELCVKKGYRLNCDLKRVGLVKMLYEEAYKAGAIDLVYLTGIIKKSELNELKGMSIYVNDTFYLHKFGPPRQDNLEKIKNYIDSFNCHEIKGLNVSQIFINNGFIDRAKEIGLRLSIYTVDDEKSLKNLMGRVVDNITTNRIDLALSIRADMPNKQ